MNSHFEKTIEIARDALKKGDFPIGAVLVDSNGSVLSARGNENTSKNDITAHAEMQCLKEVGMDKLSKSKGETVLYCSLEPCAGCSFFIARTNIKKIVSLANDPFRPGISYLKQSEIYTETFKDIEYELINNELTEISLMLMKQYFENKNLLDKAMIFENAINK